jgi:hypothetical protein
MHNLKNMKNLVITTLSLLLFSCENPMTRPSHDPNKPVEVPEYPKYELTYVNEVPDSNKSKLADWIIKETSAASLHLSAGDYEDPDDLVEEIYDTGVKLFEVKTEALYMQKDQGYSWETIHQGQMTKKELKILNDLKNGK